jgi:hypothetical protein
MRKRTKRWSLSSVELWIGGPGRVQPHCTAATIPITLAEGAAANLVFQVLGTVHAFDGADLALLQRWHRVMQIELFCAEAAALAFRSILGL